MENLFIGLMSGTSVDSIDSALVNIDTGSFELLESDSSLIKKDLKKEFLKQSTLLIFLMLRLKN